MTTYGQMTPYMIDASYARRHRLPIPRPPKELVDLRFRLIDEEFSELNAGISNHNIEEVADALGDMLYVILGAAISFGCEDCVNDEVFEYFPFNAGVGLFHLSEDEIANRLLAFERFYEQFKKTINDWDESRIWMLESRIKLLTFWCISFAHACGIPIRRVFDEIHRSNMDKLWNEAEAISANNDRPWKIACLGNGKAIVRNEHGKVIKPPDWKGPDLRAILFPEVVPTTGAQ